MSLTLARAAVFAVALLGCLEMSAATIKVTNTKQSGTGSFAAAMKSAQDGDTIAFSLAATENVIVVFDDGFTIDQDRFPTGLTIDGSNSGRGCVFTGACYQQMFYINAGNAITFKNVEFRDSTKTVILNCGRLMVDGCSFYGNYSTSLGGAIYNLKNTAIIVNSSFVGNVAKEDGGAICANGTNLICNCTFIGNRAGRYGGAVYEPSSPSSSPEVNLVNSVFIDNTGVNAVNGMDYYGGVCFAFNCIFSRGSLGVIREWRTQFKIPFSDVYEDDAVTTNSHGKAYATPSPWGKAVGSGVWVFHNADWSSVALSDVKSGSDKKAVRGNVDDCTIRVELDQLGASIGDVPSIGSVFCAPGEPSIEVAARQRYPWNGLVDLKFTVTGTAGTTFDVAFTATDEIGGTNVPMKTLIREDGSAASSTAAVSPGTYRWAWNAAADLPKGWTCRGVSISADANVRTYTVKFNANGGTGTMQDEKFTYGFAQPLTANAFKKDGCMFAGWATSADGEKVYNDEQSVGNLTTTSGGSVTLFAVWKEALYMVVDLSTGAILYLSDLPSSGWSDSYKDNKMAFRRIEPGTYKMGSPAGEVGRMPDEQQHSVTLTKAFYIGIFEVTQSQWNKLMGTTPSNFSGNSYNPVEKVSYEMIRGSTNGKKWPSDSSVDSTSFMGKLRAKVGLNFDLPTEAEWEYACRAGCTAAFNNGMEIKYSSQLYDGHSSAEWLDGDIAGSAIYWGDGVYDSFRNWSFGAVFNGMDHPSSWAMAQQYINKTLPVGMLRPNAWGLYDMHGNVCEWCLDWVHESNGLGSSAVTDPQGLLYGSYRAVRSGSWHSPTFECRAAFRGTTYTPSTQNYMIGFRVACPVD